jgi:hypothetical protein
MQQEESPDPRDESEAQRDDRNLAELLQELRVAGLGVQVLFGFLLSLPFTAKFSKLSQGQRELYLASLVLAAVSTALLLGPVAYHRMVFRQHLKERLVRAANAMAVLGLAAVGLTISSAFLLVISYVATSLPAALITVCIVCLFGGLWFAFPLVRRRFLWREVSRALPRVKVSGAGPGAHRHSRAPLTVRGKCKHPRVRV